MIIKNDLLRSTPFIDFEEEITFLEEDIKKIDLLSSVKNAVADIKIKVVMPFVIADINLKADLVLLSSRTLKPVPYSIDESDVVSFLLDNIETDLGEDSPIYLGKEDLDLYPYLYDLLVSSIPFKVISKDDPEVLKGDSWEMISEEEYEKRKKETNNPFKDKLEDFLD